MALPQVATCPGPTSEPGGFRSWTRAPGGVGFRAEHPHTLQVGEQIMVHFRLDDPQRSEMSALAVIRRIEGLRVGAEFLDAGAYTATNRLLGFYLMA